MKKSAKFVAQLARCGVSFQFSSMKYARDRTSRSKVKQDFLPNHLFLATGKALFIRLKILHCLEANMRSEMIKFTEIEYKNNLTIAIQCTSKKKD